MLTVGQAVVIEHGPYDGEPAVIVYVGGRTVDVLLSRTGDRVTVLQSSVDQY
jgi:hypothetical protein